MNVCEQMRQASPYHDGELSPEDAKLFEAHLAQCPICAGELERLKSLSSLLASMQAPHVPDAVIRRLYESASGVRERVVITLAGRLMAAAAAILITCTVWSLKATSSTAFRLPTANSWELAAVTLPVEAQSDDVSGTVRWIVEDLTVENGHD